MSELVPINTKEVTLNRAGATRERGAKVIADAMSANKMTLDKNGDEHSEPDHTIRLRAEELRAKYTGDIKPDGMVVNINNPIIPSQEQIDELRRLFNSRRVRDNSKTQTGEIIDIPKYKG